MIPSSLSVLQDFGFYGMMCHLFAKVKVEAISLLS